MPNNNTIIVTGGAGYIGSHTIIELIAGMDCNVVSIDNYSNSSPSTFDRIERISGKRIRNYELDICDAAKLKEVFETEKNISGIIHFAAFKAVGESVENPYKYYHNNITSLLNILECAKRYQVPNFIFSSSCSVYGNVTSLPVKEDTPTGKAECPYAYTKQIGEQILQDYANVNPSLRMIALRYFNPVGAHISGLNGELPLNRPSNLVPVITNTAIGKIEEMTVFGDTYPTRDGTCIRDYIHVSDIADAHVLALRFLMEKKSPENYHLFNLGTGKGVTVREAIDSFERVSGRKLKYRIGAIRPGDVAAIYSDSSLSEKVLGWKPRYNLDDMMSSAWKWELELQKS